MAVPAISAVTGTVSDDLLHGPCEVWGVAVEGSASTTAIIQLHNNISFTGTILVQLQTNQLGGGLVGAGTFEVDKRVMFAAPVRFDRALSVTASAGAARYWIYIGGRAGASIT